jgi:hypothetical protein
VVQGFLVSPKIAAIALCQARYVDEATKREWMTLTAPALAARFGWADQYQVLQASSDRCRAPQRLLARSITGYAEGLLPAQAIATLRGISLEALEEELREAGVTPAERPIRWAEPADLPDVRVDLAALDEDLAATDDGQDTGPEHPPGAARSAIATPSRSAWPGPGVNRTGLPPSRSGRSRPGKR